MISDIQTITYEQCPFDEELVRSIYRKLPSSPDTAGKWVYQNRELDKATVFRRRGGYFQFFYGDPTQTLFSETLDLEPMQTQHDAEWTIEKHDEGCYLVTSVFCKTFGPVQQQELLDEILDHHGLWLEDMGTYCRGAAKFSQLNAGELLSACNRLVTVESWCLEANKAVTSYLEEFWGNVKDFTVDQIQTRGTLEVPSTPDSHKRRQPLYSELDA